SRMDAAPQPAKRWHIPCIASAGTVHIQGRVAYSRQARHRLAPMLNTTKSSSKTLPPLARLRAFEAVGRLSGIRKAAQELCVDHAVICRHLRSLEEWARSEE